MPYRLRVILITTTLAVMAPVLVAHGQESPSGTQPKRTILDQHDQSDVPGKQIVIGTAEIPAGTAIGWHSHPGDESGYALSGNLVLKTRGKPDLPLKAGDHFFNPRGAVHSLAAAPGTNGGMALSTWVVDKDKPLAEMVK